MKKLLFSLMLVFYSFLLVAQSATLKLKENPPVTALVSAITDVQLFTDKGTFALQQIISASFWDEYPDSVSIEKMRSAGVVVYLKKIRLAPLVKKDTTRQYTSKFSIGPGLGIDYGGLGMKFHALPFGRVGLFGGLGYNTAGLGYQAGLDFKFTPHKRSTAFLAGMWGNNAVVNKKSYDGFSVGFGARHTFKKSKRNYISVSFILPFRSKEANEALSGYFKLPVLISFGIGYGLK